MAYQDVVLADSPILYYRLNDATVNLLQLEDASFEGGTVGNWTGAGSPTLANSTASAWVGTHSLLMTATVNGGASAVLGSGASLYLPAAPGAAVALSAWVKTAAGGNDDVKLVANFYASDKATFKGQFVGTNVLTSSSWQQVTLLVSSVPAGAAYCQFVVSWTTPFSGDAIYIDGVQYALGTNVTYSNPTTTVADSSVSANTGTIHGGVEEISPGAVAGGGSTLFDGGTGYIETNSNLPSLSNGSISAEAWVKSNGSWITNYEMVHSFASAGDCYCAIYNGFPQISLHLGGSQQYIRSVNQLSTNTWHHVVWEWDGTNFKIYVDGSIDTTNTPAGGALTLAAQQLFIGAYEPGTGFFFNGQLAEPALYPYALTATQVYHHFVAGPGTQAGGISTGLTSLLGTPRSRASNLQPGMGASRGAWTVSVAEGVGPASDTTATTHSIHRSVAESLPAAIDTESNSEFIAANFTSGGLGGSLPFWGNLYTNGLVFKKSIGNFINRPSLHCSINGGWDQITLEMDSNDTSATAPARGDIIKLYEQGGDGTAVYMGIIEDVPDTFDATPNHELLVSGMVVELGDTLYNKSWTSTDVATIVADIVSNTKHLSTNSYTCPLTGVLATYNFQNVSAVDALTECLKMAGPNYYWFADQQLVWFINVNFAMTPVYTIAQGVDYSKRVYQAPITDLKNYVLGVGGVPSGATTAITASYTGDTATYGTKALIPPLSYPNLTDQPTLQNMVNTVGAQLDRVLRDVEITLPAYSKRFSLANRFGSTMQYFEPNGSPFDESYTGAGGMTQTLVITDIVYDGPVQTIKVSDLPFTADDFQYMLDQMAQRVASTSTQTLTANAVGNIPASAISSAQPSVVAGIVTATGIDRISTASNAYITVSWTPNATTDYVRNYAVTYQINGSSGPPTTQLCQAATTRLTGLTPGATYNIYVYAINAADAWSNASVLQQQQAATDTVAPDVPANLQFFPSPRGASLFWTASTAGDVQGYELQLSTNNGPFSVLTGTDGTTPVRVVGTSYLYVAPSGTFPNTALAFQVRAVDYSGNRSAWSASSTLNSDGVYFDELIAGNIQAAGTITGGAIQTGSSGKRVIMDANGLRMYDGTTNNYGDLNDPSPDGLVIDLNSTNGSAFFAGTVSASQIQGVQGGVNGSGARMWIDFKDTVQGVGPLLDVNDGQYDRVQIGNLAANGNSPAQYGLRATDASGNPIFDSLGLIQAAKQIATNSGTSRTAASNASLTQDTGTNTAFTTSRTQWIMVLAQTNCQAAVGANNIQCQIAVGVQGSGTSPTIFAQINTLSGTPAWNMPATCVYVVQLAAGSYTAAIWDYCSVAGTFNGIGNWDIHVFQLGG